MLDTLRRDADAVVLGVASKPATVDGAVALGDWVLCVHTVPDPQHSGRRDRLGREEPALAPAASGTPRTGPPSRVTPSWFTTVT